MHVSFLSCMLHKSYRHWDLCSHRDQDGQSWSTTCNNMNLSSTFSFCFTFVEVKLLFVHISFSELIFSWTNHNLWLGKLLQVVKKKYFFYVDMSDEQWKNLANYFKLNKCLFAMAFLIAHYYHLGGVYIYCHIWKF